MKKWLVPLGVVAVLLIGGFFLISFYCMKKIEPELQSRIGPEFAAAKFKVKPLYLSAEEIRYEDPDSKQRLLEIEEVRVFPALLSFLKPPLRIREITVLRPSFFFYRTREGIFIGPWMTGKQEKGREISEGETKKKNGSIPTRIKIDRFRIEKGSVDFEDLKTGGSPAHIKLRDLELELKDFQYPVVSSRSPIDLKGNVEGRTKRGNADLEGWINLKTMDMETAFKIREMDLKLFEPYYRKRVSAEIDSGYLDIETKITVREKTIEAPGKMVLANLQFQEGEGTVFWIPAKTLIPFLKERGNHIEVKFHLKGNMNDPQFSLQETFLTQAAVSLLETLGVPMKGAGEEILGNIIKGEKGLGEELKSIERRWKKKREKRR